MFSPAWWLFYAGRMTFFVASFMLIDSTGITADSTNIDLIWVRLEWVALTMMHSE